MNVADDLRLREGEQVVVAAQIAAPVGESLAAKLCLAQGMTLNHGAHGAVEDHQALSEKREKRLGACIPWPALAFHATCASWQRGRRPKA